MDYSFTDEQIQLKKDIHEWAKEHMPEEKVIRWHEERGMDDEVYKAWAQTDFVRLGIPEEYGGIPCDFVTLGVMMEELCHSTVTTVPFVSSTLIIFDVLEFGSPEQIKFCMDTYYETGRPPYALAISEPVGGSDNFGMTTYTKEIDGKIHLFGDKTFVTNGEHFPHLIVLAKEEDPSRENKSISMWTTPKDVPGIEVTQLNKIGNQISPFARIHFDDVVLDPSQHLGERGQGFMNLMKNFEFERCVIIAMILGEAQAALEDAAAYANQRMAFGKNIARYQAVQEMLVDMEMGLRTTREMLYKTLWKMDNNLPINADAALLKRYGSVTLTQVASDALEIFGGHGFTTETRVGRAFLDCRGYQLGGGTREIMSHIANRPIVKEYAQLAEDEGRAEYEF
ncbi:acyl-CoA dehydrogenase [Gordonibacter sp. 28C]|nr:acyl-CoA dehydrogenase [Gordonibacter sp. 28C]